MLEFICFFSQNVQVSNHPDIIKHSSWFISQSEAEIYLWECILYTDKDNWIRNLNITRKQGALSTLSKRGYYESVIHIYTNKHPLHPRISELQTISSRARINHSEQPPLSQITTIWARFNSIYCPFNRKHTFMLRIYIPHNVCMMIMIYNV